MSEQPFVIVVGASAGGVTPLAEFVAQPDQQMNAAVFAFILSNTGLTRSHKEKFNATQTCLV